MLKDLTVPFNRGKMTRSYTIEASVKIISQETEKQLHSQHFSLP